MVNKASGVGLYVSCENGKYDAVTKMLTSGEDIDINFQNSDQDGNTPLIIAASNGHSSIVTCLLDAGADPRVQNQLGFTALQVASVNGNSTIIKTLMKAEADMKAKIERSNSLKLPLDALRISASPSVDAADPSGLTLDNLSSSDSPPHISSSPPHMAKKKNRAPSMRGNGSPQRKVSFAENATSSVMIIPSKEDVKMMLHKNEYNHVCSPYLGTSLETSFDGFTATVKNMAAPISKLKFKRKMKRNGSVVPYTPMQHKVPPNTPSAAATAAPASPSASSVSNPGTPPSPSTTPLGFMREEKPSVAASALSLHSISTEEMGFSAVPAPPLTMMSPKSLSFKNAAHVALATVHQKPRVEVVTEEDDSISMSVDLSAMGLYVSFDDLENPVLKKVVQKPPVHPTSTTSPVTTAANSPSNSAKTVSTLTDSEALSSSSRDAALDDSAVVVDMKPSSPPPRTPIRGLSRETAQSFHVNLEPESATAASPSPASVASTSPNDSQEAAKQAAAVKPSVVIDLEVEVNPIGISPTSLSLAKAAEIPSSSVIPVAPTSSSPEELVSSGMVQTPTSTGDSKTSPSNASSAGIETVLSDEIIYSETPSTKIPFTKKSSRTQSMEAAVPLLAVEPEVEKVVPAAPAVVEPVVVAAAAAPTVSPSAASFVNTGRESPVLDAFEERDAFDMPEETPVIRLRSRSGSFNSTLAPIAESEVSPPNEEEDGQMEPALNTFKTTSLSAIEEGAIETPSTSSKIRDGRRHGNNLSTEHFKEVFEAAQAELEADEKKKVSDAVVVAPSTGSGKKGFHLHHVSDVVAEAIRQNIAFPVTFTANGVVKPSAVAKVRAAASSFSAVSTLTSSDLDSNIAAVSGRSVSFAADTCAAIKSSADAAMAAVAAVDGTSSASSSFSSTSSLERTASGGLVNTSQDGIAAPSVSAAGLMPPAIALPAPKMVTIPLVGRKQSVVSVGGRKKSLASLLSPTIKAIGSATKAGESVESLRSKMFQEAKRRAEEYAEQQARRKEEAANLASLLKAKQEAELKRIADLKAKKDSIIARRGKAKGYGFQSIKAGLRHKEYQDTIHNSPYIKMIVEKDPDDSDTDSDWEAESVGVKKKSPKNGGAPGVPSSARNTAVNGGKALPSIDVTQNVSSVNLGDKAVSLWGETEEGAITSTTEEKVRPRDAVSSMLQINDPASNQLQSVRKTLAMIQSDRVLENKFKWAKKIAQVGSAALLHEYHDTLKEQYEEEQSRLFHTPLPDIKKSKHPKRAQTAGPYRTQPSICVTTSQIVGSHLSEAQHFADSVNHHNQSMYFPSETPLKPSQQALLSTKSMKQFKIVNIRPAVDSPTPEDHNKLSAEDSKLDSSLKAMSLELEEMIYNKIHENNGSLVFIDSANELSWHEANIQKSPKEASLAKSSGSPKDLAESRKFYNNHQIGIGKLVNAYRPWSSPAKLVKPKANSGFDETGVPAAVLESDEPDQMSLTVESTTMSNTVNTVMSQSLPGSRAGPRERLPLRPESASPSMVKFENSLTLNDGGSLMRSQVTMGSTMRKRLPLMINLVKANLPKRTRSGSSDYDGGGRGGVEVEEDDDDSSTEQ